MTFLPKLFPQSSPAGPDLSSVGQLISNISTWLLFLAIAAVIIMIIIGAYYYILSFGSADRANKGKQIITWAVIGMIVVILAKVIVNLALSLAGTSQDKVKPDQPTGLFK